MLLVNGQIEHGGTYFLVDHPRLGFTFGEAIRHGPAWVVPATVFGRTGDGYVRFALTVDVQRIRTVLGRMSEIRW